MIDLTPCPRPTTAPAPPHQGSLQARPKIHTNAEHLANRRADKRYKNTSKTAYFITRAESIPVRMFVTVTDSFEPHRIHLRLQRLWSIDITGLENVHTVLVGETRKRRGTVTVNSPDDQHSNNGKDGNNK